MNWYTYCSNDPVNRIDPSGLVDVLLSYIVDKNGGSLDSTFMWVTNAWVTVTINGITKDYQYLSNDSKNNPVSRINGLYVIDNEVLVRDFGIDAAMSLHQVGDSFKTLDDAALAWGLTYNSMSISMNLELVSAIYGKDKSYKYTDPLSNIGTSDSASIPSAPKGETLRAFIHAHAAYDKRYDNENFSGANGDKGVADYYKVPIYVCTPAGYLKKYDPSKWVFKITTIAKGLPYDPKSPDRK